MEIRGEYEGADLGDERLEHRLVRLAEQLARAPATSFPKAATSDSELEATYRFLGNDRVTPEEILMPHVRQTLARMAKQAAPVVVAHDTTEFNFGASEREDLGQVGRGKSFGFYGHFALAVARDERRMSLGGLGFSTHKRTGQKGIRGHSELQASEDNEGRRWGDLVEEVEQTVGGLPVIHVMDREADAYALLASMVAGGRRFVVRSASGKRKLAGDDDLSVSDVLSRAATVAKRTVPLSARKASKLPSYRKHHPPRRARDAELSVSCQTVTLRRPASASACKDHTLTLNLVRVFEPSPPDGEPPVEWRLWTTEPVETAAQALDVVDAYRCRWVIEEYFRALKSGCDFEGRQLESMHTLLNALALFVPIAWRLLALRTLAREAPNTPASDALTPALLRCLSFLLRHHKRPDLPPNPTARDALIGIAGLGGHIKNNGDPGWIVLGRGLDTLLAAHLGYLAARDEAERCDQS
jgi:hypothetical protein